MEPEETYCELCGVSFSIARLRTKHEPQDAAWSRYGTGPNGWQATNIGVRCFEGSGCEMFRRNTAGAGDNDLEHLAGPGCVYSMGGYSGHQISVEEMKGCREIQCLLSKHLAPDWKPESDDQDFEIKTGYFLTGVGNGSARYGGFKEAFPVRHGVERFRPSNSANDVSLEETGFPVHPTCFEIFKILSKDRFDMVDVHGLVRTREILSGEYMSFIYTFIPSFAVQWSSAEEWIHHRGAEYLAANPIDIPAFSWLVKSIMRPADSDWPSLNVPESNVTDPFTSSLPVELLDLILTLGILSSKDIANMRLASRAFYRLPNAVYHQRVLTDMPWFFEARTLNPAQTDWQAFYFNLKVWQNMKGLQNRKKIWKDVTEIVKLIEKYRKQGKIDDEYMIGDYATWRD